MKVKIVEYAERWTSGGIESYILNLVRYLDKEKFELHIVAAQKETDIYDRELSEYGVAIESILPQSCDNPIQRMMHNQKLFRQYFIKHSCDVLHLHICQGVALHYAKIAKGIGIKKVISHCHNTEFGDGYRNVKMIGHKLGKVLYRKYVDQMVACSDLAAKWLYTNTDIKNNKVFISKYLVEVDKFAFSATDRETFRCKYKICQDTKVYLNIGRLHYQKNQIFVLDVFKEILQIEPDSRLIMIGSGELKKEIHLHAQAVGISDRVIFIDKTREVNKYMSMADIFLLPSLFEGNPIVGIEAQASGLCCVFSDCITKQAKVLDSVMYLSLKKTAIDWANFIILRQKTVNMEQRDTISIMKDNGYNVREQINEIEQLYVVGIAELV